MLRRPLLDPYDLQGVTLTGDALHTRREHARFLVEAKKAHYAFTVKRNQKNLYEQLRTLPWEQATAKFYDRTPGHGRKETRVVQALTVTDLGVDFPHAARVAKVVRHRTDTKTGKQSRETVYVITDLTSRQASPERIATILRAHWVIENSSHHIRDVTFAEDACTVHAGTSPRAMATLRNLAIGVLKTLGADNIAKTTRAIRDEPQRALPILGITNDPDSYGT
ncbi:ISAs1 family transposase [Streptomyces sp. F001]|uniref:ISAs1 family transposase n=1 Tax=Streptomyces sp. F001 TaxID=1510026 RepID=UPI001F0F4C7F|nr:ISAs1 family transposase [Streptomyces sp. F001]